MSMESETSSKEHVGELSEEERLREARFDRRFRLLELKEKREDRKLKKLEIDNAAGRGIRFTSAQATVAAALLALISAISGGVIQSLFTRDIESGKSQALIEIERLRVQANIDLEIRKQDFEERLRQSEFETTLIMKAIEAENRADQIKNLLFFLRAGFISDPDGKIALMDESELPTRIDPDTSTVSAIVAAIMGAMGLSSNFTIVEDNTTGSAAAMIRDGERILLVNPAFLNSVNSRSGSRWARIAALAHEIAHHLLGHTLNAGATSRHVIELEADYFAGSVLRRLGASLEETKAVGMLFQEEATPFFPARSDRIAAFARGWAQDGSP